MKILLDTCTFLWLGNEAPELSSRARQLFKNPHNKVYVSSVSAWEIAVKHSLDRLPLPEPPDSFVPRIREELDVDSLPLDEKSTLYLPRLPAHHKDPFDRMLICQAIRGGLTILTPDRLITQYPVPAEW